LAEVASLVDSLDKRVRAAEGTANSAKKCVRVPEQKGGKRWRFLTVSGWGGD
jgi:hypothetical protein